jgi:hypothetical protein
VNSTPTGSSPSATDLMSPVFTGMAGGRTMHGWLPVNFLDKGKRASNYWQPRRSFSVVAAMLLLLALHQ